MPPTKTESATQVSEELQEALMEAMDRQNKAKKTKVKDVTVVHEGTEIILPKINGQPMAYNEAIRWLERKRDEDETDVDVYHEFECSPLDGLVAFHRALSDIYGWTQMVPTPGFFGPNSPTMVGVAISAFETVQIPYGRVEIPGIEGHLDTNLSKSGFTIGGEIRQKHKADVQKIADKTRLMLKEKSIYKGSAVKISWAWEDQGKNYHPIQNAPKFMDLRGVRDGDLIFGEKVVNDLNVGLFGPIEYSDACRKVGIPLKRGVLLYGPYGTGKTMTANVTALKAERNGWTFIYLDNVMHLKKALDFAAQYAPAVVFAEDIDRVMNGERSVDMDEILNTLDGVDTKGSEIITVFTTNHVEDINPASLRMGRLDTLVHVTPPDAAAVQRLVKLYSRDLLDPNADLEAVGLALAGQIPAFIREVTERAKIAAVIRVGGSDIKGKVLGEDVLSAAKAMEPHAELLEPRDKDIDLSDMDFILPGHRLERFAAIKRNEN